MSNEAAARITRYLDARAKTNGLDPDCIADMDVDCMLTVSDLRDVLTAIAAPAQPEPVMTLLEHQRSAPARIYLHDGDDGHTEPFPAGMDDGVTWSADDATGNGVAYVRADIATPAQQPWRPTEQQILQAAETAGLLPNTIHSWMPAVHRFFEALENASPSVKA